MSKKVGVAFLNGEIIAVHDDVKIVENYAYSKQNRKYKIIVRKVPKKEIKNSQEYLDCYLVEVGLDNFIPAKYYESFMNSEGDTIAEYEQAKRTLMKIIEFENLDPREVKHMIATLDTLQRMIDAVHEDFHPDISFLEYNDEIYNDFRNNL